VHLESPKELKDLSPSQWSLWCRDAVLGVSHTPSLDEPSEGVVRGEVRVASQALLGDWADRFSRRLEPMLDALAVVGDAGGGGDGILHDLERDWAEEVLRYFSLLDLIHVLENSF